MKNKVLGRLMADFGGFLGIAEHIKLSIYSKNAVKVQQHIVKKLMKDNKNTVYGKEHNFKDVHSVEDYQNIVPLSRYSDYDEYIDRMTEGEKNLITKYHIGRYAESSGSVGKPKLIPLSSRALWNCQCFSFSAPVGCAVKWFHKHGMRLPPQKGLLTMEITSHRLPCGKTRSCLSGIPMMYLKPIVRFFVTSPPEIMFPEKPEEMNMQYFKLRFALADPGVSYLSTIIITVLESMMRYLEDNWEMLCDDIEKGIINDSIECPPEIRAKLEKRIKPLPKRAQELRREFEKGFDTPIVPRIWPNCLWMFGMGAGSLEVYSKKLGRYTGNLPIHNMGYGASEALMAVPIDLNSNDCVMLPHNGFYEFLPVGAPEGTRPLTISEVKPGAEYELILTNLCGLYRYRIDDVLKVTGFYKQSPTVTFMYRLNQVLNIAGEKTDQKMLDWAVEQMCEHFGTLSVGHSVYPDTETTSPGHYVLFVETTDEIDPAKRNEFAKVFDEKLSESNLFISDAWHERTLGETELHFVKKGTYDKYLEMKKNEGANLNQLKPVVLLNTQAKKDFFWENITD